MICYRDRTFCHYADCAEKNCGRRLTDKIKRDAKEFGLPICYYAEKPSCYINQKKEDV